MGAVEIDNMLMILSVSEKMTEKERDIIMPLMIQGFKVIWFEKKEENDIEVRIHRIVQKKLEQLFKVVKLLSIHGLLLVVWQHQYVKKTK